MRIAGFLLLLAGWGIVLSTIALLRSSSPIASFVTAGTGVEVLGLVLVIPLTAFFGGAEMTQSSETTTALCVLLIFLVPFAAAGLSLINAGLGRSRSAAHSMLSKLAILAVAVLVYFFCGFSWQGFAAGPAHVVTVAGKAWNWIAAEPFFFRGLPPEGSPASLAALLDRKSV